MRFQSKYAERLKDVRWQKKRLEILERAGWQCEDCGAAEGVCLNVHHQWYTSGAMPWEYENGCFVAVCEDCHKTREEMKRFVAAHFPRLCPDLQYELHEIVRSSLAEGVETDWMVALSVLSTMIHWWHNPSSLSRRIAGGKLLQEFIKAGQRLMADDHKDAAP